jgi:hypothetical protein
VTTFLDSFSDADGEASGEMVCGSWQGAKVAVIRTHFVRSSYAVVKYHRTIVTATKEDEVNLAVRRARRLWQAAKT